MNLIIIGPQASGKGTQAEFIAEKLGIPHISTGDVFRQEVSSGSELSKILKSHMDKGELVPKEIITVDDKKVSVLLDVHEDDIHGLVKLNDYLFASGSKDGSVKIWDSFLDIALLVIFHHILGLKIGINFG